MNRFNRLISEGKPSFGIFCLSPASAQSNLQVNVAKIPNIDYVIVDFEHFNDFSREYARNWLFRLRNLEEIVEHARNTPEGRSPLEPRITPLARVPAYGRENSDWMVKTLLDIGYYGVVFPTVETAEQAERIVRSMRYGNASGEPKGTRGSAGELTEAIYYWGLKGFQEYNQRADIYPLDPYGDLTCMILIETQKGIDNLDEILGVPGITAVFIGNDDMKLGSIPPTPKQAEINIQKVIEACRNHSPPIYVGGGFYGSEEAVLKALEQGQQHLFVGADVNVSNTEKLIEFGWEKVKSLYPKELWRSLKD